MNFKKGSALVVTLIILGIVSTISLSLALVSARERRGAMGASKTGISYQTADEGIEKVMYQILKSGETITTINQLSDCSGGGLIRSGNYAVELLDENDIKINCSSTDSLAKIKYLKSIGMSQSGGEKSERAVKMAVPINDLYTKLLLHADGTGSSFTDSSSGAKIITANGDVTQSSSQSKFGGKSGYFDGNGDYLSSDNSDDFYLDGDFTFDFWVRPAVISGYQILFHEEQLQLYIKPDGSLGLRSQSGERITGGSLNSSGNWYHIALSRSGTAIKLFVNGTQVGSTYQLAFAFGSSKKIKIGCDVNSINNFFNGYIDEFRLSKGIARWTSNFTPEEAPY